MTQIPTTLLLLLLSFLLIPWTRAIDGTPRIVGGVPAPEGAFDFFGHGNPLSCAASLIHSDIAVSAAHCTMRGDNLYIGSLQRRGNDAKDVVSVIAEYRHPQFVSQTFENDIMIVLLKRNVRNQVHPVVWSTETTTSGNATAVGFGDTAYKGDLSDRLLKVSVPIVDTDVCNSKSYYNGRITPNLMLCAGDAGKDSCQGDSGGPLLNEQGELIGITSWGVGASLFWIKLCCGTRSHGDRMRSGTTSRRLY